MNLEEKPEKRTIQIGLKHMITKQNTNYWTLWIRKTNALPDLISHKLDINKIFLFTQDPKKSKISFFN